MFIRKMFENGLFGSACFSVMLTLSGVVTYAGETPWQTIAEGAELRIITSDSLLGGRTSIALEVRMEPGWQTYWRVPGETGVLTEVTLSTSKAEIDSKLTWPFPRREIKSGYVDHVYRERLVLPVDFEPPKGASSINADIFMGICSDICVPVKANFIVPLRFARPDIGQDLRIKQAVQLSPYAWEGLEEPFGSIVFDKDERSLIVHFDPSQIDASTIIASIDGSAYVFAPPETVKGVENVAEMRLLARLPKDGLQGRMVRLSFMTSKGAFEIVRKL